MTMNEVNSSNIKAFGYEDGDLIVEYKSGVRYKYDNVPNELCEEFKNAESKGSFMNKNVKGKYNYTRL